MQVGSTTLKSGDDYDVFVTRISPDGAIEWARVLGAHDDDEPSDIAVDDEGNVIVSGHFNGGFEVGQEYLESNGGSDAFIVKLDASGTPLWQYGFGDASEQRATGIALHNETEPMGPICS